MKTISAGFAAGAVVLSCFSIVQAQDQGTAEPTNLAIPVVRIAPTAPASGSPKITGFAEIVRAKFPLAIKYSDLGTGWRIIEYGGAKYFTKGDTAIINNEEYLVTYAAQPAPQNLAKVETKEFIRIVTLGGRGAFEADDRFSITLMKMDEILQSAINGQTGLRSFSPDALDNETGAKFNPPIASASYRQKLSLIYLAKINTALAAYSETYLNIMPPMESAFAVRQALLPFAENDAIFYQPGTATPYKVNPLFSERKREHLRGKGRLVLFYEAAPAADGMRAVLFYDGRARRVDADSWKRLSKASGLD